MNKARTYKVYIHISPSKKVYVGITKLDVEQRWQQGKNYKSNPYFTNAIKKYGWDKFEHKILFVGLTKEEAEQHEIDLIAKYKSNNKLYGYNIEHGGNAKGKVSQETRIKMSKAHIGKKHPWIKKHTEEQKQKISNKLQGRVSPMKGKHWSREQRARVGTAIVCLQTGEHYLSIREASQKTGLDRTAISKNLKGIYKQTGGMCFEYDK